jgi:hypothetical protein
MKAATGLYTLCSPSFLLSSTMTVKDLLLQRFDNLSGSFFRRFSWLMMSLEEMAGQGY